MSAPENYITVQHGNLTVNVPRRIFTRDGRLDPKESKKFAELARKRWPWLTGGSVEVLFSNARKEYLRTVDEETGGIATSKRMARAGNREGAIEHLRSHMEEDPEDPDAWMELGKLLCETGRADEGYRCFNEARKHYRRGPRRRRRSPGR